MKIVLTEDAEEQLYEVSEFIDDINTLGAGERWAARLIDFCETYAREHVTYALCNFKAWAQKGFSCIVYRNWVIAFKIIDDSFVVFQIAHGSMLY